MTRVKNAIFGHNPFADESVEILLYSFQIVDSKSHSLSRGGLFLVLLLQELDRVLELTNLLVPLLNGPLHGLFFSLQEHFMNRVRFLIGGDEGGLTESFENIFVDFCSLKFFHVQGCFLKLTGLLQILELCWYECIGDLKIY